MVTYDEDARNLKVKNIAKISNLVFVTQAFTATPSVNTDVQGVITVAHASTPIVLTASGSALVEGQLFVLANASSGGTEAHTLTLPSGVTWDGTNRVATTNAPGEYLVCVAISTTRFLIIINSGVTFS